MPLTGPPPATLQALERGAVAHAHLFRVLRLDRLANSALLVGRGQDVQIVALEIDRLRPRSCARLICVTDQPQAHRKDADEQGDHGKDQRRARAGAGC